MVEGKWQQREGLEGPFRYGTGRVLYYDVREGKYLDPTRDVYLDHYEALRAMGIVIDIEVSAGGAS